MDASPDANRMSCAARQPVKIATNDAKVKIRFMREVAWKIPYAAQRNNLPAGLIRIRATSFWKWL